MALSELQVDGRPIVPIRAIPLHTGGYVDAREVASMLSDPESMGQVTGTRVVACYRDGRGIPRRMWPHEFDDLARCIGMQPQDAGETELMAILPPGILFFSPTWSDTCTVGARIAKKCEDAAFYAANMDSIPPPA